MLHFSLPLLCLLAVGCQPRPAPASPAAPPSAGTAVAQPAAPTGDPALDTFLADLAAAIDGQMWSDVQAMASPDRFAQVVAAGRADGLSQPDAQARALGAALGLRDVAVSRAALDRVRVVTLRTVYAMNDMPGVTNRVEGDVRLDDGSTVPMAIHIGRDADSYVLMLPGGSTTSR